MLLPKRLGSRDDNILRPSAPNFKSLGSFIKQQTQKIVDSHNNIDIPHKEKMDDDHNKNNSYSQKKSMMNDTSRIAKDENKEIVVDPFKLDRYLQNYN